MDASDILQMCVSNSEHLHRIHWTWCTTVASSATRALILWSQHYPWYIKLTVHTWHSADPHSFSHHFPDEIRKHLFSSAVI